MFKTIWYGVIFEEIGGNIQENENENERDKTKKIKKTL